MSPAIDSAAADSSAFPANAVDREIVSPHNLIRAINGSNIAIKVGDAAGRGTASDRQVWLFDDVEGSFVAPETAPLTIVIDPVDVPHPPTQSEHTLGLVATATMVAAAGPSWLGMLREFGRKAACAVQQRARWTE
jgi:hypothetical protein